MLLDYTSEHRSAPQNKVPETLGQALVIPVSPRNVDNLSVYT